MCYLLMITRVGLCHQWVVRAPCVREVIQCFEVMSVGARRSLPFFMYHHGYLGLRPPSRAHVSEDLTPVNRLALTLLDVLLN